MDDVNAHVVAAARLIVARVATPVWMAFAAFDRVASRWGRASPWASRSGPADVASIGRTLARVERLFACGPAAFDTCMYRSLGRFAALRGVGVPVTLVLGVRRDRDGELAGHAWLELAGVPLGDRETGAYTPTYRYPALRSDRAAGVSSYGPEVAAHG